MNILRGQMFGPGRSTGPAARCQVRRSAIFVVSLLGFLLTPALSFAVQLNEFCTASILNRVVRVSHNGSFAIPNVPVDQGLYRIRFSCVNPTSGTVTPLISEYLTLTPNSIISVNNIQYGADYPLPLSLQMYVPFGANSLTALGQTVQLNVKGQLSDGTLRDLTAYENGTTYATSNPRIATVSKEGLVTAVSRGNAIITSRNEGVLATIMINVLTPLDSDGDGMPDDWEIANGLNPYDPSDANLDPDGDGLTNLQEYQHGTDPHNPDTDGDGLSDGDEVNKYHTDPLNPDTDGDGLLDGFEVKIGTDPLNPDTDGDGIPDGIEVKLGLNPLVPDPTTTVQGHILDGKGNPIALASATVFGLISATSDATGRFTIPHVPADLGNIVVASESILPTQVLDGTSTPTPPLAGAITDVGVIQLGADSGVVTGLVLDDKNHPAAGVNITVQSGNTTRTTVTDATGQYRVTNEVAGNVTVTALDPKSLLEAQGSGLLGANSLLPINLKLGPSGTLTGRVVKVDGVTPVGAGVMVTITGPMTATTQTDGLGQFAFDFVTLGNYTVDATDTNGNHGTSTANVEFTGETAETVVAYLGKGTVNIITQDADGHPLAAAVSLQSQSVYGGYVSANSGTAGTVSFGNVFLGKFVVSASSPVSSLGAQGKGEIDKDGQTVNLTLTMTTTGTIKGTVFQPDGTTPVVGAAVQLSDGQKAISNGSGQYELDFVPVSALPYTVSALNPQNQDQGATITGVSAQDQVVTANIVMNGFGTVVVTVVDGANALVPGAKVSESGTGEFGGSSQGTTGNDGTVTLKNVVAGPFNVGAVSPLSSAIQGQNSGSLGAGQTANVTVQLTPVGTVDGQIFMPDGVTPAGAVSVELAGTSTNYSAVVTADAAGNYRFSLVPVGLYTIVVKDTSGSARARVQISLNSQGQEVTTNITMVGVGTVVGTVRNPDGTVAPATGIQLLSSNPQVGRGFNTQTDVNGQYSVSSVPVGPISVNASALTATELLYGQNQGQLVNDGDTITVDVQLSATQIPVPPAGITLYDANAFPWDIAQDASILNGWHRTFAGNFSTAEHGLALTINDSGGNAVSFLGHTHAQTSLGGRQLALTQTLTQDDNSNLAGLQVTRKIYVPSDGYFARYLEQVTNTTQQPITLGLTVTSHIRSGSGSLPNIVGDSSGDNALSVSDPNNPDRWVLIDDSVDQDPFLTTIGSSFDLNLPALGFVFDGSNAVDHAASAAFDNSTNAFGYGLLTYGWNNITVQPGQTVAYMHFAMQQTTDAAGTASINRLEQLAPEVYGSSTFPQLATSFDALSTDVATWASEGNDLLNSSFKGQANTFSTTESVLTNLAAEAANLQTTFDAFAASGTTDPSQISQNANSLQQEAAKVRDFAAAIGSQPFCLIPSSGSCPTVSQSVSSFSVFLISASAVQKEAAALADAASSLLDLSNVRNFNLQLNSANPLSALPAVQAEFKGRVLASDGTTLIPGAQVSVHSSDLIYGRTYFSTADGNGNYDVKSNLTNDGNGIAIPVGEPATLQAIHPQTKIQSPATSAIADAVSLTAIQDLIFSNTGISTGTVRRANGAVVSSGTIGISGANLLNSGLANINPDGTYFFTGVPAGTYALIAIIPHPQGTALIGTASVTITDGTTTSVDVFIEPTGAVTGKVTTATGDFVVGLTVNLRAANFLRQASTDTGGNFTFGDVPVGQYELDAYDQDLNAADTEQVSVSENQTSVQNMVLNAGGTVKGIVTTPAGQPDAGVQVTLTTSSGQVSTTTGSDGSYRFDKVTPGNLSVLAVDATTGYRGSGTSSFALAGSTVEIDIKLYANGTVTGTVFQAVGGVASGVPITISAPSPLNTQTVQTDSQGAYTFNNVPLGNFTLDVTTSSGDRAHTANQIAVNGQTRTLSLTLNGLGNLQVTVVDAANNPVNNVTVYVYGNGQFGGFRTGATQNGAVTFNNFLAGPVSVNAVQNVTNLGGSTNGTMQAGTTTNLTVRLQPSGTVVGHASLSGNPVANVPVLLNGRQTTTDSNGGYEFDAIPLGTYTLIGEDAKGNVRAEQTVALSSNGQIVTQDLNYVPFGTVNGHVTEPDGSAAQSVSVFLQSLNATLGRYFSTITDANGAYTVTNVPGGSYTVTATDPQTHNEGESSGTIVSDGQIVTTDLQLLNNSVSLPTTLYDANAFSFDINPDGHTDGYQDTLGLGYYNNQGSMKLDLVVSGGDNYFTGINLASSDLNSRELNIEQQQLAGLNVTRKIYVPVDGYFARYIDVLANPGTSDITLNVKMSAEYVSSNSSNCYYYYSCNYPPGQIVATSSQDSTLSNADHWVVIDDSIDADPLSCSYYYSSTCGFYYNHPAVAFGWYGTNGTDPVTAASFNAASPYTSQGTGQLSYEWDNVTVPAGGTVAFMHFVAQQTSRASAKASIDRLTQLSPEAIAGITPDISAAIQNFSLPSTGLSSLPALTLGGTVTGTVYAADGVTPVPYGNITFKSKSPFYGRTYNAYPDGSGAFSFTDNLSQNPGSGPMAIAIADFNLQATAGDTNQTASAQGTFAAGSTTATQNVIFSNTGTLSGKVTRSDGSVLSNGYIQVTASTGVDNTLSASVSLQNSSDGSYSIPALSPGAYHITVFDYSNDSFTTISGTVLILAGKTVTQDLVLGVAGVSGNITNADGTPRTTGGSVYFALQNGNCNCSSILDQNGRYSFADLIPGTYSVSYYDNALNRYFSNIGTFTTNASSPAIFNFQIPGLYPLQVALNFASGGPVGGQTVYVVDQTGTHYYGTTSAAGVATFTSILGGLIQVSASPFNYVSVGVSDSLTADASTQTVSLVLPVLGTISGTVQHANGTPIPNVYVVLRSPNLYESVYSDSNGAFTFTNVPGNAGNLVLQASYPYPLYYIEASQAVSPVTTDGQTIQQNLSFPAVASVNVQTVDSNQQPVPNLSVQLTNSYNYTYYSTTDSSGIAQFSNEVTLGKFTVQASNGDTASGAVQQSDDQSTLNVTLTAPLTGTITGTVYAGDGASTLANLYLTIYDAASGRYLFSTYTDSNGNYTASSISAGVAGFTVTVYAGSISQTANGQFATNGETKTVNVVVPAVILSGTVFYNDGVTPVQYPSVFASSTGNGNYYYEYSNDSQGDYHLLLTETGGFNITAQDYNSGLTGTASVSVASLSEPPVSANVLLPPAGTVFLTVVDSFGNALTDGRVTLSSGSGFQRTQYVCSDCQTNLEFDNVPAGNLSALVFDYNSDSQAIFNVGQIVNNGDTVTQTLTMPALVTVFGNITDLSGMLSPSAQVRLSDSPVGGNGEFYSLNRYATANANGAYSVTGLPAGNVTVNATDATGDFGGTNSASIDPTVSLMTEIDVQFSGFASSYQVGLLDSVNGYKYFLDCSGELNSNSGPINRSSYGIATALQLVLDGNYFGYGCPYVPSMNFQEATFSNASFDGLSLVRSAYVPPAGGFVRYLDTFTNTGTFDVNVNVGYANSLYSGSNTNIVVAPSSTGNTYAVADDTLNNPTPGIEAIGFVMAGTGSSVAPVEADFSAASSQMNYRYAITVPAGQSVTLMEFLIQGAPNGAAAVASEAQALTTLTDANALIGISATQQSEIVNFKIPQ